MDKSEGSFLGSSKPGGGRDESVPTKFTQQVLMMNINLKRYTTLLNIRRSDSVFFYDDHILPDSGKGVQLEQHSAESIEPANHDTDLEIQKHYEDLKRSLSEEFNKKMTHWGQKKLSKESSDGRSATGGGGGAGGADDRQLSAEFRKKLEEWQRMKGSVDAEEPTPGVGAGLLSFL